MSNTQNNIKSLFDKRVVLNPSRYTSLDFSVSDCRDWVFVKVSVPLLLIPAFRDIIKIGNCGSWSISSSGRTACLRVYHCSLDFFNSWFSRHLRTYNQTIFVRRAVEQ